MTMFDPGVFISFDCSLARCFFYFTGTHRNLHVRRPSFPTRRSSDIMAVYTHVPADELARFLKQYDEGELVSAKGIAEGVENSNYLIDTTRGRYILTLYEKRVAEKDKIGRASCRDRVCRYV